MNNNSNQTAGFRIKIVIASQYGPRYERAAYVAKEYSGVCRTWDGAWYTEKELDQIKVWKTRGGAERWLAQRPTVADKMGATIEVVPSVVGGRLRMSHNGQECTC